MKRFLQILLFGSFAVISTAGAIAQESNQRLVIVNGNSGHVIYDDGRDDLYCVTRRHIVGYDDWGYPVRRRTMHCR